MKYLITTCCIAGALGTMAQGTLQKQADSYYTRMAYTKANDYYQDLAKKKNAKAENLIKAAECEMRSQNYKKAGEYYDKAYQNTAGWSLQNYLDYLQVLKFNGSLTQAKQVLEQMNKSYPGTHLYQLHQDKTAQPAELKKDTARYKIRNPEGLNTRFSEFSPVFADKGKTMVFVSNRERNLWNRRSWIDNTPFLQVMESSKKDSLQFKKGHTLHGKVETRYHDGPVCFSVTGDTMYLTRSQYEKSSGKGKVGHLKLFTLTKNADGNYINPQEFPYNSESYSVGHAALSPDGRRMYFISDMPGGSGQTDIWYTDKVNGQWQKPVNAGKDINTEGREMFPTIYKDGTLFFSSDARSWLGGLDLCYAFPDGKGGFMPAKPLDYPINSQGDDFGFCLNSDQKTGYLSSNRAKGHGGDDIYYFSSSLPLIAPARAKANGTVLDEITHNPVAGAKVYAYDHNGHVVDSALTDNKGNYSVYLPAGKEPYRVGAKGGNSHYDKRSPYLNSPDGSTGNDQANKQPYTLMLEPKYRMTGTVKDAENNSPVSNVKVTITDKATGLSKEYITDGKGGLTDLLKTKRSGDHLNFLVKMEKPGYITTSQEFSTVLNDSSRVNLDEFIGTRLQPVKAGIDVGKVLNLEPIYYDLGKWDIRPDAARELDKVVTALKENPGMVIELGSHTDCRSSASFNKALSTKRAKAAVQYIISKGIDAKRIYGKGYGESKLINKCECEGKRVVPCTEEEHQQNRRTEFIIVKA